MYIASVSYCIHVHACYTHIISCILRMICVHVKAQHLLTITQCHTYSCTCTVYSVYYIVNVGRKCALSVRWWWLVDLPLTSTALLSPKESAVPSFIISTSWCFTFFMAKDRGRHSMHIHVHVQCHCYCQGFSKHTKYKSLVSTCIMYMAISPKTSTDLESML